MNAKSKSLFTALFTIALFGQVKTNNQLGFEAFETESIKFNSQIKGTEAKIIPANKPQQNIKQKFFVNTLPKGGGHLLTKCLSAITGKQAVFVGGPTLQTSDNFISFRENKFPWGHFSYSDRLIKFLELHKYKRIFIYRDPRDWLISFTHWLSKPDSDFKPFPESATVDQKVDILIESHSLLHYIDAIKWLKDNNCYFVKFEDLVGPQGGGSYLAQIKTIKELSNYLGFILSDLEIKEIAKNLFGNTATFREGKIGSWKTNFSSKNKMAVKQKLGQVLIDLGYEKDLSW